MSMLFTISCGNCGKDKTYEQITTEIPARPAGATDLVNFATPKMDVVRVGFIGLGMRGPGAVQRFTHIPGVEIKALCDLHMERAEKAQGILTKAGLPEATLYGGSEEAWKELCERDDIDLIYIATDWKRHAPMMVYAMEQGKHVACEVPAAMTLEEIWDVVNTAEATKKHCMMLENCVYDFFELTTLNMAQEGVFGEIIHTEGSYIHCLEPFWDAYESDWRLEFNKENRGDVYATHGLGPACQLLDIHRGDKMNFLVAVDTKPLAIPAFIEETRGEKIEDFQNGDHTLTLIGTEKGKTIHIQHNVATPRPYSRMYQLTGTKGFANKYPNQGYAIDGGSLGEGLSTNHEDLDAHSYVPEDVKKELMAKYKHPIHVELEETAKKVGGHGGMDFIMDYRLIYCLRNGLPLDMDVYDLAEWCSMAPLTKLSLENGSAPVQIPDFTRGAWDKVKGYRHAMVE
ncbi:MAG: Gfo/Idh/MocA family oxidoreductase [Rikenellaceae bacterium]